MDNGLLLIDRQSFGDFIFLNAVDWVDYKTKEQKGLNIVVLDNKSYEKWSFRLVGLKKQDLELKKGDLINIDQLAVRLWSMNGQKGYTLYGNGYKKI